MTAAKWTYDGRCGGCGDTCQISSMHEETVARFAAMFRSMHGACQDRVEAAARQLVEPQETRRKTP